MSDQLSESLASELDGVAQDMAVGRLEDGKVKDLGTWNLSDGWDGIFDSWVLMRWKKKDSQDR